MQKWGVYVGFIDDKSEFLVKECDSENEATAYEQDFECDLDEYTFVRPINKEE